MRENLNDEKREKEKEEDDDEAESFRCIIFVGEYGMETLPKTWFHSLHMNR